MRIVLAIYGFIVLQGCVGPVTPFGGSLSQPDRVPEGLLEVDHMDFYPEKLSFHGTGELKISIRDDRPNSEELQIFYNGREVTNLFSIYQGRRSLEVFVERSHFRAGLDHHLSVKYRDRIQHWESPSCEIVNATLKHIEPFDVESSLVKHIDSVGKAHQLNPALLAGLIAQESSFNTRAVSRAKALGLTQITNIADDDLKPLSGTWPRHRAVRRYPSAIVRGLVLSGRVNETNEWRLNSELSVLGGARYLNQIQDYWNRNSKMLQSFSNADRLAVILASYNSGKARVKNAIRRDGLNFLKSLHAARHYVDRVKSYCYAFSTEDGFE